MGRMLVSFVSCGITSAVLRNLHGETCDSLTRVAQVTLQFCLWDQFKEVEEMSVRRSTNLARLTGHILGSFALSLTTLKVMVLPCCSGACALGGGSIPVTFRIADPSCSFPDAGMFAG